MKTRRSGARICIDLRREVTCGVGRSAYLSAFALDRTCATSGNRLVVLASPETQHLATAFPNSTVVVSDARYFSRADLFDLPDLVQQYADVFWSNQFYISPFFDIPVVTMIHDLWPIQFPGWLPDHEEVIARHGHEVLVTAHELIKYFDRVLLPQLDATLRLHYVSLRALADKFMMAMMLTAAYKAAIIATPSMYSYRQLADFCPAFQRKIRIVSPFAEPRLQVSGADVRSQIPQTSFQLLCVGKFDPRKNHRFLIEALRALFDILHPEKKITVNFVGDIGYRSFGKALVEAARRICQPPHRFMFHDRLPDELMPKTYAQSDLLLMPSLDEGFGLPLLEAMTVGLPALVSRRGALPEVGSCFVSYSDLASAELFAEDICRGLEDLAALRSRARLGQEDVRKRYSFARTVGEVNQVVDCVVCNGPH